MPFTLAHPALVLPLERSGLPLSALVIGAMVPDAPLFVDHLDWYATTHSWVGVLTVDVVLTLVSLAVWVVVLRDAVVDLGPRAVRERRPPTAPLTRRAWLLAVPAAVIGAASHKVWDSFTHEGRWGLRHVPVLNGPPWHGWPRFEWAQYVSGAVGMAVLALWALWWLHRTPRCRDAPHPRALTTSALPLALVVGVLVGVARGVAERAGGGHTVLYDAVTTAVPAAMVAVIVVALLWRRSAGAPSRPL